MLEEAIGVKLFERHASGMTLTKAGDMLVVVKRRALSEAMTMHKQPENVLV